MTMDQKGLGLVSLKRAGGDVELRDTGDYKGVIGSP